MGNVGQKKKQHNSRRRNRIARAVQRVKENPGVMPGFHGQDRTGFGQTRHHPRTAQAKQVLADKIESYASRGSIVGDVYKADPLPIVLEHLRDFATRNCEHTPDQGAVVYAGYTRASDGETIYRLCRVLESGGVWATIKFFDDGRTWQRVAFECLHEITAR